MSWLPLTLFIVFATFVCVFGGCEWYLRRRRNDRSGDRDSLI